MALRPERCAPGTARPMTGLRQAGIGFPLRLHELAKGPSGSPCWPRPRRISSRSWKVSPPGCGRRARLVSVVALSLTGAAWKNRRASRPSPIRMEAAYRLAGAAAADAGAAGRPYRFHGRDRLRSAPRLSFRHAQDQTQSVPASQPRRAMAESAALLPACQRHRNAPNPQHLSTF